MEPILYSAGLNGGSSTLLHGWSKNTKVSSFARTDRLSTIACLISICAKPTFSIVSALSVIIERFPINLVISRGQSSDFKAESEVFAFSDLMDKLKDNFFIDHFN
jgi:hypothetical protein